MSTIVKQKYFETQDKLRKVKQELDDALCQAEAAKNEIRANPEIPMRVADHTIVKWQQRVNGTDIGAIINQILSVCDIAGKGRFEKRTDGDQYIYETDGPNNTRLTLIVRENVIVTVYVNQKEPALPNEPESAPAVKV